MVIRTQHTLVYIFSGSLYLLLFFFCSFLRLSSLHCGHFLVNRITCFALMYQISINNWLVLPEVIKGDPRVWGSNTCCGQMWSGHLEQISKTGGNSQVGGMQAVGFKKEGSWWQGQGVVKYSKTCCGWAFSMLESKTCFLSNPWQGTNYAFAAVDGTDVWTGWEKKANLDCTLKTIIMVPYATNINQNIPSILHSTVAPWIMYCFGILSLSAKKLRF